MTDEGDAVHIPSGLKPKWDPTITLGHVLTAVMIAAGAVQLYSTFNAQVAALDSRLAASERARAKYIPLVDDMRESNRVQDERISNLAISQREQRDTSNQILTQMTLVRENLATLNAKLAK